MPALDHRLIRLKALPDRFQTEFIATSGDGQLYEEALGAVKKHTIE